MKITCLSDTHNLHNDIILEGGDILIHAGDATIVGNEKELRRFVKWLAVQPYKHKVWIAGNHDWGMEFDQAAYEAWCARRMRNARRLSQIRNTILSLCQELGVIYLNNSGVELEGLKIWGSPDQPAFCGLAFNRNHKFLEEHWKFVPEDTNILITHCPAYGILDKLETGENVGDENLLNRTKQLCNLKLHVCGHIHPSYGIHVDPQNVTYVNAAILDDRYQIANKPITIEI